MIKFEIFGALHCTSSLLSRSNGHRSAEVEEYYSRRYFRDLISLQMALVISRLFTEENAPRYLVAHRCTIFLCHLDLEMIDIYIQISISERSSGWATN